MFSVPENIADEETACSTFINRFTARYGPVHPTFFPGPLSGALQEACNKPAKDVSELNINLRNHLIYTVWKENFTPGI